jgi:hypothetical protein
MTIATPVVHCKAEPYDVYIGRGQGSEWGNPFKIPGDGDRDTVIRKFCEYLETRPDLLARVGELHGKRLGCWCAPRACHGDVLAELADHAAGC